MTQVHTSQCHIGLFLSKFPSQLSHYHKTLQHPTNTAPQPQHPTSCHSDVTLVRQLLSTLSQVCGSMGAPIDLPVPLRKSPELFGPKTLIIMAGRLDMYGTQCQSTAAVAKTHLLVYTATTLVH